MSGNAWRGVIEEYRDFLPVGADTPVVTLLEGGTPLIRARNVSKRLGLEVYLKYEGVNPTGSFKDRGMTMAISKALEEGADSVICASTGNTSASAAAYAASAGLRCVVLIPKGAIALGKLSQALMHGAKVIAVDGNFDDALRVVREIADSEPIVLVNSLNPYRIEGQKTGAFEIVDTLGRVPDVHCIPVGNAGNITAYWKGYREYADAGKSDALPRMLGFQAAGAAPIVLGHPVEKPETIATAIRIGNPASWEFAVAAARDSGGSITIVTDEEILEAYHILAATEGVFVEPASAASVAGLMKALERGEVRAGETAVCILTGHGLKDPERAVSESREPPVVQPIKEDILGSIYAREK
jgi:threonine synthase